MKRILLIGGAGYVGVELVKTLLNNNYIVTVYDLFIYGDNLSLNKIKNLNLIKGDIRDLKFLDKTIKNFDYVIHLACISNDPSFDLNPELGKSINYDPFNDLLKICKNNGVKRFIYASSSSVYGIKSEENVSENASLKPLTDYSKYKVLCEEQLFKICSDDFCCTSIRPATVCGYSDRQRLDLVVNILTNFAFNKGEISVFGGDQLRPNIHIKDMCNSYLCVLSADTKMINGEAFNVGLENYSVKHLAELVKDSVDNNTKINYFKSNDNRSYHISSNKIKKSLGFSTSFTIKEAIIDLKDAFSKKLLKNPLENEMYFNIKRMKSINLK